VESWHCGVEVESWHGVLKWSLGMECWSGVLA
jgi:hypothetical protein